VLRATVAHDSILSVASNGGAVVWLNGELLGASRSAARSARGHQDLYSASLRAGENLLLYRVLVSNASPYRVWSRADLLRPRSALRQPPPHWPADRRRCASRRRSGCPRVASLR
jgi:hypothetical protein